MPTGLTQDAGWEIGVSRTIRRPLTAVWEFIVGPEGIALWLGIDGPLPTEKGAPYRTADGLGGELRSYRPGDRVRLTYGTSTVQVAVTPGSSADRTVLSFHQERLASAEEREERRTYWKNAMDRAEAELT
ncbi:SRPBCC domain-containing protein [Streptomyces sp. C11-1]|uniref:SRPBCC domain-containing protein n=1 Tax=Streptomyces durocortorensis TaxID=2811104 RepID=A0ABY9VZ75_9ACTN|nr:SRPBCC domain-containing protein [Streptomyces durocortorensis]WNF28883.1 SRPBCC domain-containing protein [Streptomyces durocortorensis]